MTTKLQSLTELWQEFNLTGTQSLLDELATEITTRQDESDASRKQLIELIRTFKKTNSDETRSLVAPLLKHFQNEIDSLSKRSKAAEKAFFDIYKKFFDITDPVPTLEYCMENMKNLQKLQDLEIENAQLRETLGDCSHEITEQKEKLKQLRDVEEKFRNQENKMDELLEEKISRREQELNTVFEEKAKVIEEDKVRNNQKLAESETKLKQVQNLLDEAQTELFEIRSRQESQTSAKSEEVEIILVDLDRANMRAAAAEREVVVLQEQLAEARSRDNKEMMGDSVSDQAQELGRELAAKEKEVMQLVEDVQKANRSVQDNAFVYEKKTLELQALNEQLAKELEDKSAQLTAQSDYEGVKKDLSIMKSLYFPSHSTEEEDSRPLEVLILERSKTLQNDNSMLRQDKERMFQELTDTKQQLTESRQRLDKQTELISQLEDHVEQLQNISTPYREEAEGRSSSDMLAEVLKSDLDTDSPLARTGSPGMTVQRTISGSGDNSALLPIVEAQRERLRLRNEELETANLEQGSQIRTLGSQVQDLQADNVKLFEKIRFLQSCGGSPRRKEDTEVAVERRYQGEYENRLDPFQSFSQSERKRKYGQLSVAEKVILSLVRFIASNKTARLMVTLYSVLLHGLVFVVLYKMAMTESCKHDMAAKWHEKYIEHMQDVHGNVDNIG